MPLRSLRTRSTPSLVRASLSRVWEAARTNKLSHCLSLIRAWFKVASPLITLMKSYTTRRSHPMIKSRFRKPTSKSITTVLKPRKARPDEKLALVVVLPTPPLPEVTTTIFVMNKPLITYKNATRNFTTFALPTCRLAKRPALLCLPLLWAEAYRWCDRFLQ